MPRAGDPEEVGVELVDRPVDESTLVRVDRAWTVAVRIEVLVVVPPVRWDSPDRVAPGVEQIPEVIWRIDPAWQAAPGSDDGDRFVGCPFGTIETTLEIAQGGEGAPQRFAVVTLRCRHGWPSSQTATDGIDGRHAQ